MCIFQVSASDPDSGLNGQVKYYITGGTKAENFAIDEDSGLITTLKLLDDFDATPSYTLQLIAKDLGNPQLEGNATVVITVVDVNEPPRFSKPSCLQNGGECNFQTPENSPIGTLVGSVIEATDSDTKKGCVLKYKVVSPDRKYFAINETSGEISNIVNIDRELKEDYRLVIQVSDCATPPLSEIASINLKVEDLNDNDPKFLVSKYVATVSEDATIGQSVLKVVATGMFLSSFSILLCHSQSKHFRFENRYNPIPLLVFISL